MNTKTTTETINQKCLNSWAIAGEELLKTIHFYGRDCRAAQNSDFELMFPTCQRVVANIEFQDVLRRICNKFARIGSPHIVSGLKSPASSFGKPLEARKRPFEFLSPL